MLTGLKSSIDNNITTGMNGTMYVNDLIVVTLNEYHKTWFDDNRSQFNGRQQSVNYP